MFKTVNGYEKINFVNGINLARSLDFNLRRAHNKKLARELNKRSSLRYNFLTNRKVSVWNELSQEVIDSKTVNIFKAGIDREVFGVEQKRRKAAKAQIELNAVRH